MMIMVMIIMLLPNENRQANELMFYDLPKGWPMSRSHDRKRFWITETRYIKLSFKQSYSHCITFFKFTDVLTTLRHQRLLEADPIRPTRAVVTIIPPTTIASIDGLVSTS